MHLYDEIEPDQVFSMRIGVEVIAEGFRYLGGAARRARYRTLRRALQPR